MAASQPHELTDYDRGLLEEARTLAAERGIDAETQMLRGDTVDELVAYADTIDADLIVVGSRGHGSFASAVLGSVSRGVLREARRPVLVVRGTGSTDRSCGKPVAGGRGLLSQRTVWPWGRSGPLDHPHRVMLASRAAWIVEP